MESHNTNHILFNELTGKYATFGIITLNRPTALNALSLDMLAVLDKQLRSWEVDPNISAVIINSSSPRAFCAGADVKEIYYPKADKQFHNLKFFKLEYRLNDLIKHYPKPYIALINGISMGGGLGISINGKYVIAAENLSLAMPETAIGLYPDVGATFFLSHCPDYLGMYLGLTGNSITLADAIYCRLVNSSVLYDNFADLIADLLDAPAAEFTDVITKYQEYVAPAPLAMHADTIKKCFSKGSVEEILQALRADGSSWAIAQASVIDSRSPTSLKVTHKALTLGRSMDFSKCMQMEFNLTMQIMQQHDFNEGVRSVLIQKTQNPKWLPATLSAISDAQINDLFTLRWKLY